MAITQAGDTTVISPLSVPGDAGPATRAESVQGGFVAITGSGPPDAARLPLVMRRVGELVYTPTDNKFWQLIAGTADANWVEKSFGKGGLVTVATNAARDALPSSVKSEGMLAYSQQTQCYYELQADLATWTFFDANPALATQLAWYVDPSGSDDNPGTIGLPLATLSELTNRLNPRGKILYLTANMTVTVSGTGVSWPKLALTVGVNSILAIYTLSVVFSRTSGATITLTGAVTTNAATKTRGQLVTGSGTFVAGERIRFLTGTCAGAVCYSSGLNGDAQHTYIFPPCIPTVAWVQLGDSQPALVPAIGDTCVVDTIQHHVNQVNITAYGFARVAIFDAIIRQVWIGGTGSNSIYAGNGGNVMLFGCQCDSTGGTWNSPSGAMAVACRTLANAKQCFSGNLWAISYHVNQGSLSVSGSATSYGLFTDGAAGGVNGRSVVGQNNNFDHPGEAPPTKLRLANASPANNHGAFETQNGHNAGALASDSAIIVCSGSWLRIDDYNAYCWGSSSNWSFGFAILGGGFMGMNTVFDGVISGVLAVPSDVNLSVGNMYFAYSDGLVVVPNSNCGIVVESAGFLGSNSSETDGGFYLRNQGGNLAGGAAIGGDKAGQFKIRGYVATTTNDATALGNPTLNVIFTDDSGVARTVPVASSPSLAALGGNGGEVIVESAATHTIYWSVTGIVSAGTSKFSVRMRIEKDCFGA